MVRTPQRSDPGRDRTRRQRRACSRREAKPASAGEAPLAPPCSIEKCQAMTSELVLFQLFGILKYSWTHIHDVHDHSFVVERSQHSHPALMNE